MGITTRSRIFLITLTIHVEKKTFRRTLSTNRNFTIEIKSKFNSPLSIRSTYFRLIFIKKKKKKEYNFNLNLFRDQSDSFIVPDLLTEFIFLSFFYLSDITRKSWMNHNRSITTHEPNPDNISRILRYRFWDHRGARMEKREKRKKERRFWFRRISGIKGRRERESAIERKKKEKRKERNRTWHFCGLRTHASKVRFFTGSEVLPI